MDKKQKLKPNNISDLLDVAFSLYRKNFLKLVGVAALVFLPIMLFSISSQILLGSTALIDFFQVIFISNFVASAITYYTSRIYISTSPSIVQAYYPSNLRYVNIFGVALIQDLILATPITLLFILYTNTATGSMIPSLATLIILLFMIGLTVVFFIKLSLVIQIATIEKVGPLASLRRSYQLSKGFFWKIFCMFISLSVIIYLTSNFPSMIFRQLSNFIDIPNETLIIAVCSIFFNQIGRIISSPIQYIVFTLLYYDLRVRKEGYDLEVSLQETTVQ